MKFKKVPGFAAKISKSFFGSFFLFFFLPANAKLARQTDQIFMIKFRMESSIYEKLFIGDFIGLVPRFSANDGKFLLRSC